MAPQRTIATVQPVTGWRRWGLTATVALVLLVLAPAGAATGQAVTEPPVCAGTAQVDVVFVGRVTTIVDDLVTFSVSEVRKGGVNGDTITVEYPTKYNARELDVGGDYLVPLVDETGASAAGAPRSFVDTAEIDACGSRGTLQSDGSAIDTGAFAGVSDSLVSYGAGLVAVVAGVLVLLVLLGRFLDRRSRYRKTIRL
jgi:hypothetical protein